MDPPLRESIWNQSVYACFTRPLYSSCKIDCRAEKNGRTMSLVSGYRVKKLPGPCKPGYLCHQGYIRARIDIPNF